MFNLKEKVFTLENNLISLISYGELSPNRKTVLFIGVTHGEEPQGEFLINKFLEQLKNNEIDEIQNNLIFIPCLNPDGKNKNQRGNSNGVDINRNFDTKNWEKTPDNEFFSGEAPNSEAETRFLTMVVEKYKPDFILSLHAPFRVVNFDGPAQKIAEKISEITGYPVQEDIGYPTPGSFGTFCGVERKIPIVTLELPENLENETLWKENKEVFEYLAKISF